MGDLTCRRGAAPRWSWDAPPGAIHYWPNCAGRPGPGGPILSAGPWSWAKSGAALPLPTSRPLGTSWWAICPRRCCWAPWRRRSGGGPTPPWPACSRKCGASPAGCTEPVTWSSILSTATSSGRRRGPGAGRRPPTPRTSCGCCPRPRRCAELPPAHVLAHQGRRPPALPGYHRGAGRGGVQGVYRRFGPARRASQRPSTGWCGDLSTLYCRSRHSSPPRLWAIPTGPSQERSLPAPFPGVRRQPVRAPCRRGVGPQGVRTASHRVRHLLSRRCR